MGHYEGLGFKVGHFKKQKDGLMKFLTFATSLKGHRFEEFKGPGSSSKDANEW